MDYVLEIKKLKEEMNALILAHNYQKPEIQNIADFIGDSLDLCLKAKKTDAEFILFCGVDFMAETAAILTGKRVLIPDLTAQCPMVALLPASAVREAKKEHPDAGVVLYINTLAEAKAEADIICTSANCIEVINSLKNEEILFGPDKNLAWFASQRTKKKIIPIPEDGHCVVHQSLIHKEDILLLKEEHPSSVILVHPECVPEVQEMADYVLSTNGMVKTVKRLKEKEFIIGTEEGLCYRLKKENPDKIFHPLPSAVCVSMKKHSLEKVYHALLNKAPEVRVPEEIAKKAKKGIERMLDVVGRD